MAAAATLALFIALFLPWFRAPFIPASLNAVEAHDWMFVVALLCLGMEGYLIAMASTAAALPMPYPHHQMLIGATGLIALLTLVGFLAKPDAFSWSYGAYAALAASLTALLGQILPMQARGEHPIASLRLRNSGVRSTQPAQEKVESTAPAGSSPFDGTQQECPNCHLQNWSGNRFCQYCGNAIKAA